MSVRLTTGLTHLTHLYDFCITLMK